MKKTLTALALALSFGLAAGAASANGLTGPNETSDPSLPIHSSR